MPLITLGPINKMNAQVYVIGDVGILEELDLLGFQYIGGPEDGGKDIDLGPGYALPHDTDVSPACIYC